MNKLLRFLIGQKNLSYFNFVKHNKKEFKYKNFNTNGQMVTSKVVSGANSSMNLNLAAGLYIVTMNVNSVQHSHKIIIQ